MLNPSARVRAHRVVHRVVDRVVDRVVERIVVGATLASLSIGLATSLVACAPQKEPLPFEPAGPTAAPDPSQVGPYPVGVRTLDLVDELRIDEDTGQPRPLTTEVWYPATEASRNGPFEQIRLYDHLLPALQEGLTPEQVGIFDTISVRDAAIRSDDGPYPVVVFSHGKGGIRIQSNYFTAYLASHGFIVLACDHDGDTINDLLAEVKGTGNIQQDSTVQAIVDRPNDIIALLDLIQELPADDPLLPMLDMERVGMSGHSFGALTSFLVASRDNRIDAMVAQTPTSAALVELQSSGKVADLHLPIFIQSGGLDHTLPEVDHTNKLWPFITSEQRGWLSLAKAGHFTYSDLCVLDVPAISAAIGFDASNVLDDGCGPDNTPLDVAYPAIRRSAIGWFNRQLRGSTGSDVWLDQHALDEIAPDLGTVTRE